MDGTALVLCEKAFLTTCGKTAHGLVRYTERYQILGVIDSQLAGRDAGEVLDGKIRQIPIYFSLEQALKRCAIKPEYLVIGLAPDGGRLPHEYRPIIVQAIKAGLNIDSGLHEFLSEDPVFSELAEQNGVQIRDVRKPPARSELHFFSGEITKVRAIRIAILGTDSAVGKRTVAILLNQALVKQGIKSLIIGTGQTSWFQGVRYGLMLDSLVNDFVSGEIEHAIIRAWQQEQPKIMLLEGQGNITHPAYPGGFELIAAARPHAVILQHAPARQHYDGMPDLPIGSLDREIKIIELLSQKKILALTLNHEQLNDEQLNQKVKEYEQRYQVPCCDVLKHGCNKLVTAILNKFGDQLT